MKLTTLFAAVAIALLGMGSAYAADTCANGAPTIDQAIQANKDNSSDATLAIVKITGKAEVLKVRQLIADKSGADIATVNYGSFALFDRPDAPTAYMIAFDLEGCGAKAAPITKEEFADIILALGVTPETSAGDDKGI